ncbi:cell wall-active antibiotics response protein LiaF [Saccharibacillus sp. CPCC 101409]|uniref:cell wall-active antibiotics response protein LiaF n=1 Tax=Saccharibacillus sp. CPCC 101409 TaxID=3058041 RepID=UPI002672A469|nr:cell wall-active antibiotics response protein LiaF [Saccharibacillus sp. CPCC 101409]MDO3408792.1 cell wall-active antibiotics response protein LiaF [Saccharibacillus sp. CPCC 101409]
MKKSGALWLIAIGGIFLAQQLGYFHFSIGGVIRTFWPMILIVIGLQQVMNKKKHGSSLVGNLAMVAIGGYFQARNLGLTTLSSGEFFKFFIPAALIATGIYVLVRPSRTPSHMPGRPEAPQEFYGDVPPQAPPGYRPPPVPPAPIEPLESPLDRMFVNLDKPDPQEEERERREKSGRYGAWNEDGEDDNGGSAKRAHGGAEFQKIGEMARDIGRQTGEQIRKIDFSGLADEVRTEVNSAMDDLKKSMGKEHKKNGKHGSAGISLEKEPFSESFDEDGRFYEGCREDNRRAFYDREEMKKAREKADKGKKQKTVSESNFIGDYYIGKEYFRLKPLNISHFIGDTVIDLTKAQIPYGTTRINISSFIGDVIVYVPNDPELGLRANSSSFIGDHDVLGHTRSGMVSGVNETQNYEECAKRIKLSASSFIGDVHVTVVG